MSNANYKKDLHDVALAVAQGSKDYTDKRIDDLEWQMGTYKYDVTLDNTTALVKAMPSDTYKLNVNKIYGDSKVSDNLVVVEDGSGTLQGVSYTTDNATGKLTLNGTATSTLAIRRFHLTKTIPANTPLTLFMKGQSNAPIRFCFFNGNTYVEYFSLNTSNRIVSFTKTTQIDTIYVEIQSGGVFNNQTFEPMLVVGTYSTLDFKVGYDGIHNLELSGLKVEGANLFDDNGTDSIQYVGNYYLRYDNYRIVSDSKYNGFRLRVKENTTYYIKEVRGLAIRFEDSVKNIISGSTDLFHAGYGSFTTPSGCAYIFFSKEKTSTLQTMLNYGSTALDYVPYIATTISIDLSSILYNGSPLLEGGCLKGYDGICDSITPYKATKKMHKIVVDKNTRYQNSSTHKDATLITLYPYRAPTMPFKCIWYGNSNISNITYEPGEGVGNLYIVFTNAYVSDTELKNAMLGVVIIYELATPIEVSIDWSSTLRRIPGYSSGSITAQNIYDMPVHSEIDYLIKEVKA